VGVVWIISGTTQFKNYHIKVRAKIQCSNKKKINTITKYCFYTTLRSISIDIKLLPTVPKFSHNDLQTELTGFRVTNFGSPPAKHICGT